MWFSWYDLEEEYSEAAPTSVLGEQYIQKHGEKCLYHIERDLDRSISATGCFNE